MKRLLILAMGLLLAASAHAAFAVKAGSTSVLVPYFKFIDTTTGTAKTDITGTDIDLSYVRAQADHSAKVDAVAHAAIDDAWDDDEVFEIDDTLHPGLWRIDWPDAAFADGADWVILTATVSGAYSVSMLVWLVDYDPQDTVRLGLTALPPAAADAAGGLPISDAGELDLDTLLGHLDADISSRGTSTLTEDSNIGIDLDDTTGTLSDAEVDDDAIGDGTNLTEAGGDGDHLTEAGGDGDQFTGIAWDGDWDADVESEVNDALVALNLDHFLKTAVNDPANLGGDGGSEVVENTVMALWLASDGDSDGYNYTTDSAEAIRDQGDAAWTTGGGTGLTALASGTAQSGTASTIVLAAAAAFANDELNGNTINIHTGTGAGQSRVIISNTLADDTCNIAPNWTTNPGADSEYEIVPGSANVAAISLDAPAANNLEAILDGTGAVVTLSQFVLAADDANGAVYITNAGGPGLEMTGTYGYKIEGTSQVGGYITGATGKYGLHIRGPNMRAIYLEATAAAIDSNAPVIFSGSLADQVATIAVDVAGLDGDAMRGTDNAALAATALSNLTWTDAKAGFLTGDAYARLGAPAGASIAADIAAIKADTAATLTDTGTTLPATLTTLATSAALATVDTVVDAILVDTGATLPATLAGLATSAAVAVVDANVDAILADTAELQGNQGNWATATGFSTHSAAGVATALKASTGWEVGNTLSFATVIRRVYGAEFGKMTYAGGTVRYYDTDGTTELGEFTVTTSGRTPQ